MKNRTQRKRNSLKSENVQRAQRDETRANKRDEAHHRDEMFRPRKPVNASFVAEWDFPSSCPACGLGVDAGQRARYNPDGAVVHHAHTKPEAHIEVCPTCWLSMPCECDTDRR
jgi:hypothetical protein